MPIPIKTPRFIIRNFLPEEETIYVDLLADAEVAIYLPKRTREQNIEMFKIMLADYALNKPLNRWAIFDLDDHFMGMCMLRTFDVENVLEAGYSFHQKYWGNGLATAVVQRLLHYAADELMAIKVVAITALENIASQKVLQKAGLVKGENLNRFESEVAYFELDTSHLNWL